MHTTKVNKWGNSQGVILPKHLLEHVGMRVGDTLEVTVDAASGTIELSLAPRRFVSPDGIDGLAVAAAR